MNCNCEHLFGLREQSDRLRELGEEIKEYAELLYASESEDSITGNALEERMNEAISLNTTYGKAFVEACKQGQIIVKFRNRPLNPPAGYLIARVDGSQDRDVPGITYHCSTCDEDLYEA